MGDKTGCWQAAPALSGEEGDERLDGAGRGDGGVEDRARSRHVVERGRRRVLAVSLPRAQQCHQVRHRARLRHLRLL